MSCYNNSIYADVNAIALLTFLCSTYAWWWKLWFKVSIAEFFKGIPRVCSSMGVCSLLFHLLEVYLWECLWMTIPKSFVLPAVTIFIYNTVTTAYTKSQLM